MSKPEIYNTLIRYGSILIHDDAHTERVSILGHVVVTYIPLVADCHYYSGQVRAIKQTSEQKTFQFSLK